MFFISYHTKLYKIKFQFLIKTGCKYRKRQRPRRLNNRYFNSRRRRLAESFRYKKQISAPFGRKHKKKL